MATRIEEPCDTSLEWREFFNTKPKLIRSKDPCAAVMYASYKSINGCYSSRSVNAFWSFLSINAICCILAINGFCSILSLNSVFSVLSVVCFLSYFFYLYCSKKYWLIDFFVTLFWMFLSILLQNSLFSIKSVGGFFTYGCIDESFKNCT